MKVLITGAGGFIGAHLVAAVLERGDNVIAVDLHVERLDSLRHHPELTIANFSITDYSAMGDLLSGVEVVHHLASAHLDVSLSDDVYTEVNVVATRKLAELARMSGVRRFVHCSSVGVMGNIENPPADEQSPCVPTNVYGRTKLAGEQAILAFAKEQPGFITVARPAWVYGPGCPRTERLFRMVKKGRLPIFGNGKNQRHPIYVADLIQGLLSLAERDEAIDELFILGGARSVTLDELLGAIAEVNGVGRPKVKLPLLLGLFAGHLAQAVFAPFGKSAPISPRSMDFYQENNSYSIKKARRMLDFAPEYDLVKGMERTKQIIAEAQRTGR